MGGARVPGGDRGEGERGGDRRQVRGQSGAWGEEAWGDKGKGGVGGRGWGKEGDGRQGGGGGAVMVSYGWAHHGELWVGTSGRLMVS